MNPLEKLSKKIGFTSTETNVVLFLLFVLFTGIILNIIKEKNNNKQFLEFDYRSEDSLFAAADIAGGKGDSAIESGEKKIASQRELLDFTKGKLKDKNSNKDLPPEGKININEADGETLLRIPGIGPKTVAAIMEYRKMRGRFNAFDDLLKIRGVGKKKLEKIKGLITLN